MNKQKKYIILIILLLIMVAFVQYKIFNIGEKSDTNSLEKSTDFNENINSIKDKIDYNDIKLPPTKKQTYIEPKILAKNYILIDSNSFYTIAEKDADIFVPIASTTKIMTAIIVLENYDLDDMVTISKNASSQTGSKIFLKNGEKISVENLLKALLISSGNDSAMALAEKIGLEKFLEKMNQKAQYLGLSNTIFKDPAGLDDNGRSSAKDLGIMTAYALKNDKFKEIVKISETNIYSEDNQISHKLDGSNRLIKNDEPLFYEAAIGVKTGFTHEAGHCLVSAAEKNGILLISVVLNTYQAAKDASARESKKLLEWGYDNYNFD